MIAYRSFAHQTHKQIGIFEIKKCYKFKNIIIRTTCRASNAETSIESKKEKFPAFRYNVAHHHHHYHQN